MLPESTIIVADDLTGSADSALPFWRAGSRVCVVFNPAEAWPENPGVLSICTHSRALSEAEAGRVVSAISLRLPKRARIFKKIDSTLRGWIGAESRALLAALPGRTPVFAPAYPSKGRTLGCDRVYRVHGTPLAATEFAPEVTGMGADSQVDGFVRQHFGSLAPAVQVVPAESLEELAAAVEAIAEPVLWIGSPGLGIALAGPRSLPTAPSPVPERLPPAPIIVAAGSRRTVTQQQVRALEAAVVPRGAERLQLLRITEPAFDPARALALADALGAQAAAAAHVASAVHPRVGLILTGGDIAAAACKHLGIGSAEIVGEVEDGLPVLRAGRYVFVTKAGGFGNEVSLVRAYARLTSFLA